MKFLHKVFSLLLVTMFSVSSLHAQEGRTVTGKVADASSGEPLPGVSVVVKGASGGTATGVDGTYTISVSGDDAVLSFSFIGYASKEEAVDSRSTIDVSLQLDAEELDQMVVTALGISREKKSLGYAVSSVQSEEVESKSQGDIAKILNGKLSGVQITQGSGLSGTASNVIIRGYTSINGSNQPLYIVDGVPFDSNTNQTQDHEDGRQESSRFLDLDPNNIENITVLKGLSAATLYGASGRNGVILITTKTNSLGNLSGRKGEEVFKVTINQSYYRNNPVLADYQTNWGGGWNGYPAFYFSNWGANFADLDKVAHPYGSSSVAQVAVDYPNIGEQEYEYKNYNSVKNFFKTGEAYTTSVGVNTSGGTHSFNLNYSNSTDDGFTPKNTVDKNNLSVGGVAKFGKRFTISGTFNYANTKYSTPPIGVSRGSSVEGANSSIFANLLYNPRSVDLQGLPYQLSNGQSIYYRTGNDIQNALWTVENTNFSQNIDRFFGQFSFGAKLIENKGMIKRLDASYRLGLDGYTEFAKFYSNRGSRIANGVNTGLLRESTRDNGITDHTFLLNSLLDFSKTFKLNLDLGFNARRTEVKVIGFEAINQVVFGNTNAYNFTSTSTVENSSDTDQNNNNDIPFISDNSLLGAFANMSFSYNDYLYLNVAVRNDWTSTLEKENRSILYPSVSLSWDATNSIEALKNVNFLRYLKARVGYGSSAGYPKPYQTRTNLNLTTRNFVTSDGTIVASNASSRRLGNPDLKPERVGEIEYGLESSWLNNRLGLDFTFYTRTTTDLIADRSLDRASGYATTRINSGELKVNGIEFDFRGVPIKLSNGFTWSLFGVFSQAKSEVVSLPDGIEELVIEGYTSLGNFAIEGEAFGIIKGTTIKRHVNGQKLVDGEGKYVIENDPSIIADPNPDWTSSLTNVFSFKGINLGVEVQYRHGGDVYSNTVASLIGRGVSKDVDFELRDKRGIVLEGVQEDGSKNDVIAPLGIAYFEYYFGANENKVFDGTTVRLNEINLGYTLPKKLLTKLKYLSSVSIGFSGYNLWQRAINTPKYTNFDVNMTSTGVGNGQGFDYLTGVPSRRYGFNIKLTF